MVDREKYLDALELLLPTNAKLVRDSFTLASKKIMIIDNEYGEYWKFASELRRGSIRHPKYKQFTNKLPEYKVNSILPKHLSIDYYSYLHSKGKVKLIDNEYGEFEAFIGNAYNDKAYHPERLRIKRLKQAVKLVTPLESVQARLPNNISIKAETYVNFTTKAVFIDTKYGEFKALPYSVIDKYTGHPDGRTEKCKQTMLKKYGVSHNMKHPELALKNAKARTSTYIKYHWETNEELVCQGGWEAKVVDYLNEKQINYKWQYKTFNLPDGTTYRPDFYLVDEDKWVEIKGYLTERCKYKIAWLLKEFETAEIWNKEVLKSKGII